jgi:hypothetical protein
MIGLAMMTESPMLRAGTFDSPAMIATYSSPDEAKRICPISASDVKSCFGRCSSNGV